MSVEVGHRLRERRQQLGRPLTEIAAGASVSVSHLSEIENGRSQASLPVLVRLGRVLHYPLTELLPRIGGHRVHQTRFEPDGPSDIELGHPDLNLNVAGIRLTPGETVSRKFERRSEVLIYVVTGQCRLTIGDVEYALLGGDSADLEHTESIEIVAMSDLHALVIVGHHE